MAAGQPQEACHCIFGDFAQAGGRTYPAPFAQMINDGLSLGLRDLSIEQRCVTSLRELLATKAAAQEADTISAIDFAYCEIALACETKLGSCTPI